MRISLKWYRHIGQLVPLVSVGWYRYQMSATHAVKGRHVGSATRHPELA